VCYVCVCEGERLVFAQRLPPPDGSKRIQLYTHIHAYTHLFTRRWWAFVFVLYDYLIK